MSSGSGSKASISPAEFTAVLDQHQEAFYRIEDIVDDHRLRRARRNIAELHLPARSSLLRVERVDNHASAAGGGVEGSIRQRWRSQRCCQPLM